MRVSGFVAAVDPGMTRPRCETTYDDRALPNDATGRSGVTWMPQGVWIGTIEARAGNGRERFDLALDRAQVERDEALATTVGQRCRHLTVDPTRRTDDLDRPHREERRLPRDREHADRHDRDRARRSNFAQTG